MTKQCDHPWHGNPGLITACPTCGEDAEPAPSIPATIWLLVDEDGRYDCWGYDFGDGCRDDGCAALRHSLEEWRANCEQRFGLSTQIYKIEISVPKPARVEISIDLGGQQSAGKAAPDSVAPTVRRTSTSVAPAVPDQPQGDSPGSTATRNRSDPKDAMLRFLREAGWAKAREIGEPHGMTGQAVGAMLGNDDRFVLQAGYWSLREEPPTDAPDAVPQSKTENGRVPHPAPPPPPRPRSSVPRAQPRAPYSPLDTPAGVFAPPKDRVRPGGESATPDEEARLLAFLDEEEGAASLAKCCDHLKLSERQFRERFGSRLSVRIRAWGRGWRVERKEAQHATA